MYPALFGCESSASAARPGLLLFSKHYYFCCRCLCVCVCLFVSVFVLFVCVFVLFVCVRKEMINQSILLEENIFYASFVNTVSQSLENHPNDIKNKQQQQQQKQEQKQQQQQEQQTKGSSPGQV